MKISKLLTLYASLATGLITAAPMATAAWTSVFIGTSSNNGAYSSSGGVHTISAAGAGASGTTDNIRFAYDTAGLNGDGSITARILTASGGDNGWRTPGIMIRESTAGGSMFATSNLLGTQGTRMTRRTSTGATTSTSSIVSGVQPVYWLRVTRAGNVFTAYRAPDVSGVPGTWVASSSSTIAMSTTALAGLYIGSNSSTSVSTATFDNVSISSSSSGPAFVNMTPQQRIVDRLGAASTDPNLAPTHYLDIQQDPTLEAAALGINPNNIGTRVKPYTIPQPDSSGHSFGLTTFNSDYWSDAGNLGYISDGTLAGYTVATDNALRRVQNYAFYNGCIAVQPKFESTTTDGTASASYVKQANGGQPAIQPIATCRAQAATANGGVAVWANGLITAVSTQTGQGGSPTETATADVNIAVQSEVVIYRDATNKYRMRLPNTGEAPTGYLDADTGFHSLPYTVTAGNKGYVSVYGRTAYKLPSTKIPRDICLTSQNELTLVSVYDTVSQVAQIAVFANQSKNVSPHNCPYLGMINEGSFSQFVFLGYVDLPIQDGTYITAASNGRWKSLVDTNQMDQAQWPIGPTYSCIAGEAIPANASVWITNGGQGATFHMYIPGSSAAIAAGWVSGNTIGGTCPNATASGASSTINLSDAKRQGYFNLFTSGNWGLSGNKSMSEKGVCVVASRSEKKLVVIDLTPTIAYFKSSWVGLSTAPGVPATFDATLAAWDMGYGTANWPGTFTSKPAMKPVVDSVIDLSSSNLTPSAVRLGQKRGSSSGSGEQPDKEKLWVGTVEGTLLLYDVSKFMAWPNDSPAPSTAVIELNRGFLGRNITHFACTRGVTGSGNAIFPAGKAASGLNAAMYATCRGERGVYVVVSNGGQFAVTRIYRDSRLSDPVAAWPATRGAHLCVLDFNGKQLVGFRTGPATDPSDASHPSRGTWPIYDTTGDGYEIGGVLPVNGNPFTYTCDNVN